MKQITNYKLLMAQDGREVRVQGGSPNPLPHGHNTVACCLLPVASFSLRPVATIVLWFVVAAISCPTIASAQNAARKVIVLGFDGMDPRLCTQLMDAGKMPNCAKLREGGGFKPLGTSIPPQSPVAWSNFITGAGPGVHGIFDFIHRDPKRQGAISYSATEFKEGDHGWEVDEFQIPLTFWPFNHNPTQTLLRRHGTPFWDYLDQAKIPIRIYDIPSNYPPSKSHHGHMCCLSGMGVPDLLGGLGGTYQLFSEETIIRKDEGGGVHFPLVFSKDAARVELIGPSNSNQKQPVESKAELAIYRDPKNAAAKIVYQNQTVLLKEGEWSNWHTVDYELAMPSFLPKAKANGIVRFYLQQVRPVFKLYVTPVNIDPLDPGGQVISEPPDFVTRIGEVLGRFYTAGFQEDHKALSNKVFKDAEYHQQATFVLEERFNLLKYARDHYEDGLLFFYFSSTDLQGHMFWWDSDEPHPTRSAEEAKKYHQVMIDLYCRMDKVIGEVVDRYGKEATILVMSDHGFGNFKRQFHLNSWLRDNGYLGSTDARSLLDPTKGALVDWKQTRAYALGLNGLYINLRGRERDGIVTQRDRAALMQEISDKLLAVRDPVNGKPVVKEVYRADKVYAGPWANPLVSPDGSPPATPDLIVGYYRGYRASWATTLGDIPEKVIEDNDSAWSADHCVAADEVPGVIFSNKPILRDSPSLIDMAPTILEEFGVATPDSMTGKSLFKK